MDNVLVTLSLILARVLKITALALVDHASTRLIKTVADKSITAASLF